MHSTFLRGSDFKLTHRGAAVEHERFFGGLRSTDRVGLLAPGGIDGLGACLLLLAHVTAFYDRYRAAGGEFFAYPDYYTFQRRTPAASYSMFDVWPGHKDVPAPAGAGATLDAILDRAITVLLVPDGAGAEARFERVQMASWRRNIRRCYAYAATGCVERPALEVACDRPEPAEWAGAVLESVPASCDAAPGGAASDDRESGDALRSHWVRAVERGAIPPQSFAECSPDRALGLIGP